MNDRPIRTLIVDDDPAACRLHARYVQEEPGFTVSGAVHSGPAAMDAVSRVPVDLVLLDIHLPEFSGIEVLHRLRAAAGTPIDVIVISSARDRVTVRQALSAQVAGYLVKPFSRAVFAERLRAYRAQRAPLAATNEDAFGQHEIDSLWSGRATPQRTAEAARTETLPKGLSAPTMELIVSALRTARTATAAEIASAAGTSRATARRYLDYLNQRGTVDLSHRYGRRGRPELIYRLAPPS